MFQSRLFKRITSLVLLACYCRYDELIAIAKDPPPLILCTAMAMLSQIRFCFLKINGNVQQKNKPIFPTYRISCLDMWSKLACGVLLFLT